MKPKTVLTTGQLLQWLEKNDKELFIEYRKSYLTQRHEICGEYLQWKYDCLTQNEKLMQTPLSLGQFVPCKDGKVLEKPKGLKIYNCEEEGMITAEISHNCSEYQQAMKEVLFEGYKITKGTDMYHLNKSGNSSFYEVSWIKKDQPLKEFNVKLKQRNIEDLARQIEPIPNDNFWAKVGL